MAATETVVLGTETQGTRTKRRPAASHRPRVRVPWADLQEDLATELREVARLTRLTAVDLLTICLEDGLPRIKGRWQSLKMAEGILKRINEGWACDVNELSPQVLSDVKALLAAFGREEDLAKYIESRAKRVVGQPAADMAATNAE